MSSNIEINLGLIYYTLRFFSTNGVSLCFIIMKGVGRGGGGVAGGGAEGGEGRALLNSSETMPILFNCLKLAT